MMETPRLRRRRSRRKARKKQIALLVVVALVAAGFIWTRILIDRRHDATMFVASDDTAPPPLESGKDTAPGADRSAPAPGGPRRVILFVGEGLGLVPLTAARVYAVGEDGTLAIDRLPETALVRTTSRNAQTADAAAAMTAYMTGVKVDNEVLSQTPETRPYDEAGRPQAAHGETTCASVGNGKPVVTLLELAKTAGRGTGVVTTARVTQPIAAAGYAHLCQRDGENAIAAQLVPGGPGANARLIDGVDVVLGGGWQHFLPKDDPRGSARSDSRDLFAELRAKGYAVVSRQAELAAVPIDGPDAPKKVLGLFNASQMTYDLERTGTTEPSLAEMTGRAIDMLARNAGGYLLVVEGGRIGGAFDAGLARRGLQEARAFDDAVRVAVEKVRATDPDLKSSTIVVTADHDHTLVMNGNATLAGRTIEQRPGVLGVVRAYDEPTQFATDAGGRPYTTLAFAAGPKRVKGPRASAPPLSDLALGDRNVRYESAVELPSSVGGADVLLAATGANAPLFHGTLDNVQVFTLLGDALGL